jgi:Icc protein
MQFLPQATDFATDARPPAYRRLLLQPDGTLDTEVVWLDDAAASLGSASGAAV